MKERAFRRWCRGVSTTMVAIILTTSGPCWSQTLFQEVSDQVGLTWKEGDPYGIFTVAWPDFNSDGFPDLWASHHAFFGPPPQLFINQAGSSFTNIIDTKPGRGDLHCSTWADFDNDGDPDVYINAGAEAGKADPTESYRRVLLVNDHGHLVEQATTLGLSPGYGSGRSALWFDWDKDGLLDIALFKRAWNNNAVHPSQLFAQTATGFVEVSLPTGFILNPQADDDVDSTRFGVVSDLFGDDVPDLIVFDGSSNQPSFLVRVYRNETVDLEDISNRFPVVGGRDAVVADFNQDSVPDIFIVDGNLFQEATLFHPTGSGYLQARLVLRGEQKPGVSFKTPNTKVTFDCSKCLPPIFIGSHKLSPKGKNSSSFTLSATDPIVNGLARQTKYGTYINYDKTTRVWSAIMVADPSDERLLQKVLIVTANSDFSDITPINFMPVAPRNSRSAKLPIYLEYDPSVDEYVDRSAEAGFIYPLIGYSVVAGDFDNDMDQDIYIRQASSADAKGMPLQSVYYENQGDGTFVEVADARGALIKIRGPGEGIRSFDIGPPMAVADYDNNGFLDILVAVEESKLENGHFSVGAPTHLFKNQGNGNHWLQVDLQGTVSNRDAIGAKVLVYTPDGKVQVRMQDGGNHISGQNQHRLHFGLGANTQINSMVVVWPTGKRQTVSNVTVDQILRLVEQKMAD